MPRYFFHVQHQDDFVVDREGVEILTPTGALKECSQAVREILAEPEFENAFASGGGGQFLIADVRGRTLLVVPTCARLH